jgi:O-antigen/teichoic acid export membrane protein
MGYIRRRKLTVISLRSIRVKLQEWDWNFVKGSAIFSLGQALAGLLGFSFSVVVAKAFSPGEYGAIQYAIAIASVVSIGTQPFGQHVIARFLGKYKDNTEQLQQIFSNSWVILVALAGITLLLAGSILIIVGMRNVVGILIIFLGITVFYIYWGLARGFLVPGKLTIAYLGGNLLQLFLVSFVIYILNIRSTLIVLVIYGFGFMFPPILLQKLWPMPISLKIFRIEISIIRDLLKFAIPIWISHGCYMLFQTMDILLLEHYWGTATVGVYAVAKTLAHVSLYLPTGIATFLMPKTAGSPSQAHRGMLDRALIISLAVCVSTLVVYILLYKWFVMILFGSKYVIEMNVILLLALGMIMLATNQVVTAVLVGRGKPGIDTIGRIVAVCCASLVGWLIIPVYGSLGAALVVLSGPLAALLTYFVLILSKERKVNSR